MLAGVAQQFAFDALQSRAGANGEEPALFRDNRPPLSCREFWAQTTRIAGALWHAGVRRGDVVAAALPDGPDLIAWLIAAARVAPFAPLNISLHPSELAAYLDELSPRVLISDAVDGVLVDAARSRGITVLHTQTLDLTGDQRCPPPVAASDVVLLLQTSATTGRPKVVPLTSRNLSAMAWNTVQSLQLTSSDRFLSLMPLCHLQGLLSALAQLMSGGAVMATAGFEPGAFPRWLKEFGPTWFTAGPALHRTIVALLKERGECAPAGLRFVRSIGAAMPDGLRAEIESALGVPVVEGYGLTEAGAVTSNPLPPAVRKTGSAGRSTGADIRDPRRRRHDASTRCGRRDRGPRRVRHQRLLERS